VSWHTLQPVQNPRVLVGMPDGKLDRTVPAKPAGYTDAKSKQPVYAYHAKIADLKPDTAYLYCTLHDGAAPEFGTFRTAPRGRVAFTFTSFGDQGTPTLGKKFVLPPTLAMANAPAGMPLFVNDNLGGPVYVTERAPWSAVRNAAHAYGFAAFTVDPGVQAGDATTIKVTYYDVMAPGGQISPFESFTLRRPRRD
jgi:hypothetical protein